MNNSKQIEINTFFKHVLDGVENVRRQSFDNARKKISHEAFVYLFQTSVSHALMIEDAKFYNGFRVLAIDGSTIELENSAELKEAFATTTPVENSVFARISVMYDVLNDFIFDADIGNFSVGERAMALSHLTKVFKLDSKNNLIIMDRGYWSPELVAKIDDSGNRFLIRLAKNAVPQIFNSLEKNGVARIYRDKQAYDFRFFKFYLPSGEEVTDAELPALYFLRWGVETKYLELKCRLDLKNLTGKTKLVILQDFFATVNLCNMLSFAAKASDEIIAQRNEGKTLKHERKTNRTIAISHLRDDFVKAIITSNPFLKLLLLKKIIASISKDDIPIRKGRSFKR